MRMMTMYSSPVLLFRSRKKVLDYPKDLYEFAVRFRRIANCDYQY